VQLALVYALREWCSTASSQLHSCRFCLQHNTKWSLRAIYMDMKGGGGMRLAPRLQFKPGGRGVPIDEDVLLAAS